MAHACVVDKDVNVMRTSGVVHRVDGLNGQPLVDRNKEKHTVTQSGGNTLSAMANLYNHDTKSPAGRIDSL